LAKLLRSAQKRFIFLSNLSNNIGKIKHFAENISSCVEAMSTSMHTPVFDDIVNLALTSFSTYDWLLSELQFVKTVLSRKMKAR